MVLLARMDEGQQRLTALVEKGWTLAAIADELGVAHVTVEKWKNGSRHPANEKAVLLALDNVLRKKTIPKRRRYGRRK